MFNFLQLMDDWILTQINSTYSHPLLDPFFVWITDLHKTLAFKVIIVPLVAILFFRKFKRQGVTLFLFLILALSFNDFTGAQIKNLAERPRPEYNTALVLNKRTDAGAFSFPSNHASNMFTFATYSSQFLPELKIVFFALAAVVSYSRVYDGVHYPTDVLAGGLMGILWGLLFAKIARRVISSGKQEAP